MARTLRTQFYISRLLAAVQTRSETALAGIPRSGSCPPADRSLFPNGAGVPGGLFINACSAVCRGCGRDERAAAVSLKQGLRLTASWLAESANMSTGVH
jgi:hypothetical protein